MAFALKASPSSSAALSGAAVVPRRFLVRAIAAPTAAAPVDPPAGRRRLVLTTPRVLAPTPCVPVAADKRALSVAQTLSRIKAQRKTALIPYITAGDPDLDTTAEALRLLDACGADVIELGVPFSDPYADGPIIQASAARALAGGTTLDAVLSMLKEVTPELSCPVVLFSYLGPIVRRGAANFTAAVKEAGVKGLVVPDLPYAETCAFRHEASKSNLELVLLTTPTTPAERTKEIAEASQGFVYLVTDKAVAVGFGISTPSRAVQ